MSHANLQAALFHLRGSKADWTACLKTASKLLNNGGDGLAPACSKSYRELSLAVHSARAIMLETHESPSQAMGRVLRIYKPTRHAA